MTQGELFSRIVWCFFDGIRGKKFQQSVLVFLQTSGSLFLSENWLLHSHSSSKTFIFNPTHTWVGFFVHFWKRLFFNQNSAANVQGNIIKGRAGKCFGTCFPQRPQRIPAFCNTSVHSNLLWLSSCSLMQFKVLASTSAPSIRDRTQFSKFSATCTIIILIFLAWQHRLNSLLNWGLCTLSTYLVSGKSLPLTVSRFTLCWEILLEQRPWVLSP